MYGQEDYKAMIIDNFGHGPDVQMLYSNYGSADGGRDGSAGPDDVKHETMTTRRIFERLACWTILL